MKTPLITRKGYLKLKQELDFLWREERPEITRKVTWAASLGDRSENADYQYNKKKLREIDRRVRYLRKCLENLKVVDYDSQQEGKVFFGAWVENSVVKVTTSGFYSEHQIINEMTKNSMYQCVKQNT